MNTEIISTKDYSVFKTLKGNRIINQKNLRRIIASMRKKVHRSPIQVNERMEIIDGQHRLEARRELGLPVEYYISKGADLTTVQDLNTNTENWKIDDYLNSYIAKGLKDYIIYKQFLDAYKFNHRITMYLLTGDTRTNEATFKEGEFKIKDIQQASEIASKLNLVGAYYDGYKRRTFCYAFVSCLKNKKFVFEEFLNKLSYQRSKLFDCARVDQYLEIIEEIYNYKRSVKDKIVLRNL